MMQILTGFLYVLFGVVWIYLGAFQIIANMVPHDVGMKFAEQHGAWMREHVFHLPHIEEKSHDK